MTTKTITPLRETTDIQDNQSPSVPKEGKIIGATILEVQRDYVLLDVSGKSEAIVPMIEFQEEDELIPGNSIKVLVVSLDNGRGATILSREQARTIEVFNDLETAFHANTTITGKILKKVRGGYTVMIKNVRAFLPGSLIGLEKNTILEDRILDFKIARIDVERNNIVVSRKAVYEEMNRENRQHILDNIQVGSVLSGTVKNIKHFVNQMSNE